MNFSSTNQYLFFFVFISYTIGLTCFLYEVFSFLSFFLFMLIASFEVLIISVVLANQMKCRYIVSVVSQTVSVGG